MWLLLFGAGTAAGLSGTISGLGSVFSYPALLATGLPATAANVTNTVALALGSVTAVPSSRQELAGQAATMRGLGVVCALGSAGGATLLLVTPPGIFERIVPFLVGGASLAILVRPSIRDAPDRLALLGVFAVSVYSGYFAAAAGVLLLALLLATTSGGLLRANALKNALMVIADVVAAAGFAVFGPVDWLRAIPLTAGLLLGSWLGPMVARKVPVGPLRIGIGIAGLGLAVELDIDAFTS